VPPNHRNCPENDIVREYVYRRLQWQFVRQEQGAASYGKQIQKCGKTVLIH
jgi:hypothetical protein